MTSQFSAKFTLWCNRVLMGLLAVLIFTVPWLMRVFDELRPLSQRAQTAVIAAFYCCVPVVGYALWCIDRLLGGILSGQVFVMGTVRRIRHIRWCCAGVSLICLPASFFYPPLFFITLIMAFLALMVSVLKSVMAAAVEIREENDLTV